MLRARPQAISACRRQVSYWSAAKAISASKREAARAEVPTPAPAGQQAPNVIFKSAFPPGLSQERIGELQLRQLEEDAVFFTTERPELISMLPPLLGKDAVVGATAMREALRAIGDKRPKMVLEPGRALPDQDQLAEYSDSVAAYRTLEKDTVKAAMARVREEAMRVRKEEGISEQPTLLPPLEVDVPAHFMASEVERIAGRVEYLATVYLGFMWKHFLSMIPPALEWAATVKMRTQHEQQN